MNVEAGTCRAIILLHLFRRDGRDEAGAARRRKRHAKPRIEAFNEPIDNWLGFFMFTMFTDRDGQIAADAAVETRDPLSRTTRFMLTEAHHMFVSEMASRGSRGAS